jgi:threonine/homoserine/homoserine lactone efflux protein
LAGTTAYIPLRTVQGLRELPLGLRFTIDILIEDDSGTIPLTDCISKYSVSERESLAKLCQEHFISVYTQYSKHWSWFRKWHGWLVERLHYVRTWTFSDRLFHILYFAGVFELYLLIPCFTLPSSGNWLSVCGFVVSYLFLCQYYVLFFFFASDDLLQYLLNPVAVNDYLPWRWQVTVDSIIVYFLLSVILFVALVQVRVDSVVIVVFLGIFLLLFCGLTYLRHRKRRILQQTALGGERNSPMMDAIIIGCIVVCS